MASNLETYADFKQRIKVFPRNIDRDIVVKIGSDTFKAHKEILMERMDYFRGMFTADMLERNQHTIRLDASIIDSLAFNAILDFVYNFEANLTPAILASTLKAIDFFCFEEMKDYVKRYIKSNFSRDNIDQFTEIINVFNLQDLEEDRKRYILSDPFLTPQELYVFGGDYYYEIRTAFSKYDIQTDQWIELPSIIMKQYHFCSTSVNAQIYIHTWEEWEIGSFLMFDTNTQQWTELTPPNHSREHCSMAALDGYLYVAGGRDFPNLEAMNTVERYCIANDQWTDVSPMTSSRENLELIALNGFLYAIGGHSARVEKYDPRTDRWEEVAPTNYDHISVGAAALDGRIYIIGRKSFEVYDPQENKWTKMLAPDEELSGRSLSVINRKLFVTGGSKPKDFLRARKTEYYDFEKGKWILAKNMKIARAYHYVAVVPKANSPTQ